MPRLISMLLVVCLISTVLIDKPSCAFIDTNDGGQVVLALTAALVVAGIIFIRSPEDHENVDGWVHSKYTNKRGEYLDSGEIVIEEASSLYSESTTGSKHLFSLPVGYKARVIGYNKKHRYISSDASYYSLQWNENPKPEDIWFKVRILIEKQPRKPVEKIKKSNRSIFEEK